MNSRYDIEHADKDDAKKALDNLIDSLKELRKNFYMDSGFSYNEEELKIHSKDFSVLNEKPWVIEQVVSIDKNHQGLVLSNAPDRQPLNKRPAVIIK